MGCRLSCDCCSRLHVLISELMGSVTLVGTMVAAEQPAFVPSLQALGLGHAVVPEPVPSGL